MNLDDAAAIASADPSDVLGAVERAPEQWAEAMRRARAADGLPSSRGITDVAFCGMGGSGIAGDVVAAIAAGSGRVPVQVVKGYALPAHVGADSLVICASYSGNTEETLACFEAARARGARLVVLATGGAIAAAAAAHGIPRIAPVEGLQPRAALPSLAVPALVVAERLGVLPDLEADLAEAHAVLAERTKALGRDIRAADNEAKRLAQALDGSLPLVWGQEGILAVSAGRWRTQVNENAKAPAFSSVLPELDHNEIVGYEPGLDLTARIALVVLRAPGEHARNAARIDATLAAVGRRLGSVTHVWAVGESPLARLMSSIVVGDFTSVYLALLRGVDPTPVAVIEGLKRTLAG